MPRDTMTGTDAAGQAAAAADDAFGADLYRLLAAGPATSVFSPASVAAALQMALCGARGETAAQMAAALHLANPDAATDGLRLLSGVLSAMAGDGADGGDGGDMVPRPEHDVGAGRAAAVAGLHQPARRRRG